MKLILRNNNILITDINSIVQKKIEQGLTLENPVYLKMLRQGNTKALYSLSPTFEYFQRVDEGLVIGRGNYRKLLEFLSKTSFQYEIIDETVAPKLDPKIKLIGLKLRKYQEGVPEEIVKSAQGIIKLGTGWGKTICALKMIDLLRTKTLIILPRNNILDQFKKEIEEYYRITPGIIKNKKFETNDITIASFSTLKKRDLDSLKNEFGLIIVDECHVAISEACLNVLSKFNSRYLYGMSATPEKPEDDGRTQALFFTYGDLLVDKELPQKKPEVKVVPTETMILTNYNYAEMITDQIENQERLDLTVDLAKKEINNNRKLLILTKRVDHYRKIYNQLLTEGYKNIYCINSGGNKEEKDKQKEKLRKLQKGDTNFTVILGTYSMLSMGVDIPALDTLIFAGDLKAGVLVKQSAGRIMRLFEGKKKPRIIDMNDNLNPILCRQFEKRRKFYKKNNWEIK